MTEALTVPLYIVEEHHEAFFIWNYAYYQGWIHPFGNTLLHVDSHDDMVIAQLNNSIDELEDNLQEIYMYGYREFGIATFIIPAIYRGLINNYTFLSRHDSYNGPKSNRYVASYKSEGTFFKTGEANPLLRLQLQSDESQWGNYQFYSYQEMGLGSRLSTPQPIILDIDLDFFSCDNSLSSTEKKIEITEAAYLDFVNNKYNPFRIMPAAALSASKEADRYFLCYREWQEAPDLKKVSFDLIDKRINRFISFLKENNIKPRLIDICRSRLSGYTPADQWQYIEERLIAGLSQIYTININHISEFEEVLGGDDENIGRSGGTRSDNPSF